MKQVGVDIHGLCNKCGVVAHVVVAITSGEIAQVECKQCGARHRYRSGATLGKMTKKKTGTTRARKPVAPVATVEPDLSRPIRPYRVCDTYDVGDRIDHGSFGTGVVERIAGPKKVQVFFEEGPKTLLQGRTSD